MTIKIAQRYRPFSHQPGSCCLIPGSCYVVEAYPALIRIKDLEGQLVKEIPLTIQGPLEQFTLMQDLERGCVTLFSETYSIHILPTLAISFQKNPPLLPTLLQERLSFGSHKKQDWQEIVKRLDFKEIFPLWFRLGSLLSLPERTGDNRGIFSLLKECQAACDAHRPEYILPAFKKLFLAGFGHMLLPQARDEAYQGILPSNSPISIDSPLYLLSEGAKVIRSLFILNIENEIFILPNLPPEFFAGKMVNVFSDDGRVDFEWSKKSIRRLQFHAQKNGEIIFHFHPSITHYRVRQKGTEKKKIYTNGESLVIKSGSDYLLDQFQK